MSRYCAKPIFSVPETAGRSLESMNRLFELPWYKIGLYGNKDAEQRDLAIDRKQQELAEHVENASQPAETRQGPSNV